MQNDKTVEEMMCHENSSWDIDRLIDKAFPKSWKVSKYDFDGTVEC